jgi:prefoldin subunit 5
MGQSMKSQSQFCITAVLEGSPEPNKGVGQDRRAVERLNRVRQQGIEITRQRIAQMEATIASFDRTANELEGWIQVEQKRTGIHDPANFAYSSSAAAMIQRRDALKRSRDTLQHSIEELKSKLAAVSVMAE